MNKFKGWLNSVIKLFTLKVKGLVNCSNNDVEKSNNSLSDDGCKSCVSYSGLVGHRVEVRHYSQEESIFIDVYAVMESSTHVMSRKTNEVVCKSRGIILIDSDGTVYTLSNVYEYEIRKREVFIDGWK